MEDAPLVEEQKNVTREGHSEYTEEQETNPQYNLQQVTIRPQIIFTVEKDLSTYCISVSPQRILLISAFVDTFI